MLPRPILPSLETVCSVACCRSSRSWSKFCIGRWYTGYGFSLFLWPLPLDQADGQTLDQTYQLARAFTALTLQDGTVEVARKHALQLIKIEEKIGIFRETSIQGFFLKHPTLLTWINWTYSFIHIPGTIAFLVWLYYYTTTRNRIDERQEGKPLNEAAGSPAGPHLYQARRRTLAVCNLFAFVVFTFWPCMPPRLLSDKSVKGPDGELGRSYGFVDTVHGVNGAGSVWTENRFCNQYGEQFPFPSLCLVLVQRN